MIDGLPAFPEESPDDNWKELRLALSGGMVTLRREPGAICCLIWGNADSALQSSWARVVLASAAAGGGLIDGPHNPLTPEQFAAENALSPL
jgi:hypothetical protein